ncbi:MAG: hypothetical protein K6B46_00195 [Opitutales bacterium]|nr:hypothetical protein [Opitutales bacterium]
MSASSDNDWQTARERGAGLWRILIIFYCYKILGRQITRAIVGILFCCAFPFLRGPRRHSRDFLDKIAKIRGVPAKKYSSFRHLLTFTFSLLDKVAGWSQAIGMNKLAIKTDEGWQAINKVYHEKKGAFVVCSHLGNIELFRAAFLNDKISKNLKINIVIATAISSTFARAMQTINRNAGDRLIEVLTLGIDTAMILEEKIKRGEMIIMAGDRVLGRITSKTATTLPFLGVPADFPNGVFRFAASLDCPVFAIFTLPENDGGAIYVYELENVPATTSARERAAQLQKQFVCRLESMALEHPYQWFNFFKFWKND